MNFKTTSLHCFLLIAFLIPASSIYAQPFAGGDGTQGNPYQVATAVQLDSMRHYSANRVDTIYFIQTADIDLNIAPYNTGEGWTPIPFFYGIFDGDGFSISNLYVNPTTTQSLVGFIALLGDLDSNIRPGIVNNVTLLNPSVANGNNAGALAGSAPNANLTNVRVIGGSVTGETKTGGVIGSFPRLEVQINNCSATGMMVTTNNTAANTYAGGLFGEFLGDITNSYAANTVQGGGESGGLVGGEMFGSITNSYSASVVNGTGVIGGLLGTALADIPSLVTINNSYYNSDSTSTATAFGTGLTTAQMRQRASFTGWDFDTHWFIDEGVSFPGLLESKGSFLNITGNEGWRMLTSPLQSKSIGSLLTPLWTQGFTGSDGPSAISNVYLWNETTRSWSAPTDTSTAPAAGTGFLMYVYSDDNGDGSPEGFPKRLSPTGSAISGQQSLNLSYTNSGSTADDGWNLVGNPYPTTINWNASQGWTRNNLDQTFYVWSDAESNGSGAYVTWNTLGIGTKGDGLIAPWQGFWVKANAASPQVVFTDTVRNAGGALLKQAKQVIPKIDLELEGNGLSSKAIVLFHDQAERGKDPLDAYKLHSLSSDYLLLGTVIDGLETMDIQALPYSGEPVELELVIEGSDLNGEFSLNWAQTAIPEDWEINLVDTQTEEVYQMDADGSISFSLSTNAKVSEKKDSETIPKAPVRIVQSKTASSSRFVVRIQTGTAISNDLDPSLPTKVALLQNYPNPFNPGTTINYQINVQSRVRLGVFDLLGRKVATLVNNEPQQAGYYSVRFDATSLASGVYLYRLETGNKVLLKKMTVIK